MHSISISVIIPTYNKARFLELTLASYLHQKYKNFELVVVDDGSTDDTREVAQRYQSSLNVKYVHQPNRGRAAARNTAIREATGDIVVFSDDDRLVAPEFLAAHAREYSSPEDKTLVVGGQAAFLSWWEPRSEFAPRVEPLLKSHPELAPRLSQTERVQLVSVEDIRERFPETLQKFRLDEPFWHYCGMLAKQLGDQFNDFRLRWIIASTGNMSVSRQRLLEAGLFDESFTRWGLEDTELAFRLSQAGARFVVSEEALNYHQLHARSPTWHVEWQRNYALFTSKFDSMQIPLFYLVAMRCVDLMQANAILLECEKLEREGRTLLVEELNRMYRAMAMTNQAIASVQVSSMWQ
jgi:GT2 family glycosyltransferase